MPISRRSVTLRIWMRKSGLVPYPTRIDWLSLASGSSVPAGGISERDLSVQLAGWMLMEAAHSVTAGSVQVDGDRGAGSGDDVVD